MSQAENADLRGMVRDLALHRESHDRRQLYWTLIQSTLLTAVRLESVPSDVSPADLHPLDREALGGLAAFAVFTHAEAAAHWQSAEGEGVPLRLERISFVSFLPIVLAAGVGSLYINPGAKYAGELYRHELETCLDGARKLAQRIAREPAQTTNETDQSPASSKWERWVGWLRCR